MYSSSDLLQGPNPQVEILCISGNSYAVALVFKKQLVVVAFSC